MTGGSSIARRDVLLARRLNLVASVSALTAEALRLNQKRAGIEMDVLRLELEIGRSGADAQLVQDLHEAERSAAAIVQACMACEDRIVAAEGDIEDVDRRLAATRTRTDGRDSMNQQTMQNLTLFDLLARSWQRPSAIADLRFSADGSAVAFTSVDGTVAIAALADHEPPESRIRVSNDLGQTTIRPREKPPVPLIATAAFGDGDVPLCAHAHSGFLVGGASGEALRLTAGGEVGEPLVRIDGPIVAIDYSAQATLTAASNGKDVFLASGQGDAVKLRHATTSSMDALAFSPGGKRLACGLDEGLSIWSVEGDAALIRDIPLSSRPVSIRWSGDGSWLACGLETGGFALISLADGRADIVAGFPSPVRTVCWSPPANALFASGAFRIAGWSMTAPPFGGEASGALETGRAGLVLVETMAAHPEKKLIAAGYANGRIMVAQIGSRDELLVRPLGSAVTALAWSGDGRHLAMGSVDGTAAIVTFPAQMFK